MAVDMWKYKGPIDPSDIIFKKQIGKENTKGEVIEDNKNILALTDLDVSFKAVFDKIVILVDQYKSGFECKECGGTGVLISKGGEICHACQGRGASIIVPEIARSLPTSGVICSVGHTCFYAKLGMRVLFGPHVGTYVPCRGNIRVKIMREHEFLCEVFGKADIGQVIDTDVPAF